MAEPAAFCRCVELSPSPDSFDGIYHWRDDCGYLNEMERWATRLVYGPAPATKEEAAQRWAEILAKDRSAGEGGKCAR